MTKRPIKIFFSQTSQQENYETDAATWGELKRLIRGSVSDKTCVLSGSKHLLALDEATLPDGALTIFVYPKESKGGIRMRDAKKKVKKPLKKAAKKAAKKSKPAKSKKTKAKVAKAPKKKKSARKTTKRSRKKASSIKQTLGNVVSSVEQTKIAESERLEKEAREIEQGIRRYR